MELYTSPSINLIGSVLLNFKVYGKKDLVVTAIIPEFLVENFFTECNNWSIDEMLANCEDECDIQNQYPELHRYVFSQVCEEVDFRDIEYGEILWAIDMGLPPGIPSYIQGYEIK